MRAASGFDVFITGDRNLEHPQNLSGIDLCVLVLKGRSNRFRDVLELLPSLIAALGDARPGAVIQVGDR